MNKKILILMVILIVAALALVGCSAKDSTITFESNGGSEVASIMAKPGTALDKPADPTKEGFVFGGWFSDEALTKPYFVQNMGDVDIKLYAKWNAPEIAPQPVAKTYKVNLNLDEAVDTSSAEFLGAYTEGTVVDLPATYTKVGFDFLGWYDNEALTGDAIANVTVGTEDINVYPSWDRNEYEVTFELNKKANPEDEKTYSVSKFFPYDAKLINLNTPTFSSEETFIAWYEDKELTKIYTGGRMPANDFTLYARWEELPIDMGFYPYVEKFKKGTTERIMINSRMELVHLLDYMGYLGDNTTKYLIQLNYLDDHCLATEIDNELNKEAYIRITGRTLDVNGEAEYFTNKATISLKPEFVNGAGGVNDDTRTDDFITSPGQDKNKTIEQWNSTLMTDALNDPKRDDPSYLFPFERENNKMTVKVDTSSQLFYALQYNMGVDPVKGSVAETILNDAKSILKEICSDDIAESIKAPPGFPDKANLRDINNAYRIFTWIVQNVTYDHTAMSASEEYGAISDSFTAFHADGVFFNGIAVCDGMSKAFAIMCAIEGIDVIRATSVNHAWNKIFVDGDGDGEREWYVVDCTWGNSGVAQNDVDGNAIDPQPYESYELREFMSTDREKNSNGQHCDNFERCPANTKVSPYGLLVVTNNKEPINLIVESDEDLAAVKTSAEAITGGKPVVACVEFTNAYLDAIRVDASLPGNNTMEKLVAKLKVGGCGTGFENIVVRPFLHDPDLRTAQDLTIFFLPAGYDRIVVDNVIKL